ncbi:MAG: hypothetical protein OHK0022_29430 [Roseiflexaceae bacterium]
MRNTEASQVRPLPAVAVRIWPTLLGLAFLAAGLWRLDDVPAWWDEGWTLSVARTWVEHGVYGRLLDGRVVGPGLQADFTVTAPVALMMRLFGVGLWQGRLFGLLCMAATLGLLFLLGRRLYGGRVAGVGLGLLLLATSGRTNLHPLLIGRQVLAEPLMMLATVAGLFCLLRGLEGRRWWLAASVLCWGLGLNSKAQLLPFWLAALLLPLGLCLLTKRWRLSRLLALQFGGGLLAWRAIQLARDALLAGQTLPGQPLNGLYQVTGFVLSAHSRVIALLTLALVVPTLLGLGYALWRAWQERACIGEPAALVRLVLLCMVASWAAWFALLSAGYDRYLFPVVLLGSLYPALLLERLTGGFDLNQTVQRMAGVLRPGGRTRGALALWVAALVLVLTAIQTAQAFAANYVPSSARADYAAAEFLNTQTPPGARIETYDTELHVLLQRPYHYPPDQLHIELNRRVMGLPNTADAYDPLSADPDYLVDGPFSSWWRLYEPALASGQFRLVYHNQRYDVYQRVRPAPGG